MAPRPSLWDFPIDHFLNPWIPQPPWQQLPATVSHFLGYRSGPQIKLNHILAILWATLGVFSGLTLIETVGQQIPSFKEHDTPLIIGSFGAAAVLEFYAIESPLAQPRNAILGQVLASVVGVGVRKLFELGTTSRDLIWLGGPVSCALATALMALTGTVHPPAGATALLAVVDGDVAGLGWFLLPVVLLGCALMQCVALLVNNIQRRFPVYWWTPEDVGRGWIRRGKSRSPGDVEDGGSDAREKPDLSTTSHVEDGTATEDRRWQLVVTRDGVRVPDEMYITPEELTLLEALCDRL